ncbi:MAG: hypothetical protein HZA25_02195 [Candidatus Niyogibacteria bacterium]|nr:hypothetical protein [Candidatus Niyogibacteria bacterium]
MPDDSGKKIEISLSPEKEEALRKWLESPEGQMAVDEALARAHQMTQRLQASRMVRRDQLREPITDWNNKRLSDPTFRL